MRAHQAGRAGARRRIYTRWVATVLAGAALSLGIVACGDDDEETGATAEPQRTDLALDFYVNPDHAGVFAAIVVLSAIAIVLFALVTIVERLVVTWDNRGVTRA